MKSNVYKCQIAVTEVSLIATECSCKSGGEAYNQITCVNTPVLLEELSVLMTDGLAQHILIKS